MSRGTNVRGPRNQIVDCQTKLRLLVVSEPAGARRQTLKADMLARKRDPSLQGLILREELAHQVVRARDVFRIAGKRNPQEWPVAFAEEAVYQLRIDADAPRILHVRAQLPAASGLLQLGAWHPEPKEKRWDDYVEGLSLSTLEGAALRVRQPRDNAWSFEAAGLQSVRLEYRVRLEHDALPWPPSHAEATYVRADQKIHCQGNAEDAVVRNRG